MQIITLSNGKKVGNFSSPHAFVFEDGSILPAVSEEEAERLRVTFHELGCPGGKQGDIHLAFELSEAVLREMAQWTDKFVLDEVDVVFCPLPMITALKQIYGFEWLAIRPFRTIRIEDRINKFVSIHKQCI
jgi:hypothetical protein